MLSGSVPQQLLAYWDLVPAVVGGVIGALAGGIPAGLLAKRQSDEALRRDEQQRIERQKALAFGTCVKLLQIINSTIGLSNHVCGCLALRAVADHEHMEPWQVLIPMIGFSDEGGIRFQAEEMAVFAAAGEHGLMQDMLLLANRHASSLASFQEYCRMRAEFRSIGPQPVEFNGQIGSTELTQEEVNRFKPYTIPMNNVALGLCAGLEKDVELARDVAERFGPATKRYFKVDNFASLAFPTDQELADMRQPPEP
jgi:hypothetical protein